MYSPRQPSVAEPHEGRSSGTGRKKAGVFSKIDMIMIVPEKSRLCELSHLTLRKVFQP